MTSLNSFIDGNCPKQVDKQFFLKLASVGILKAGMVSVVFSRHHHRVVGC
jgi:hypothetical protein